MEYSETKMIGRAKGMFQQLQQELKRMETLIRKKYTGEKLAENLALFEEVKTESYKLFYEKFNTWSTTHEHIFRKN